MQRPRAECEGCCAYRIDKCRASDGSHHLADHIAQKTLQADFASKQKAKGDCRVQVSSCKIAKAFQIAVWDGPTHRHSSSNASHHEVNNSGSVSNEPTSLLGCILS